jgi:hypothetical protein
LDVVYDAAADYRCMNFAYVLGGYPNCTPNANGVTLA